MIDLPPNAGDYYRRYKPINLMKKLSYLFAVLLIAGALVARPAHAETSYGDISALLKSLIAQVQELQRQLAIIQKEEALSTVSTPNGDQKGYLKLDAFNDGGTFKAGETVSIGWGWKAAVENELMELRVKSDTCSSQNTLIASGIKNANGYQWEVPASLVSEKCDYKMYLMVANVKSPNWDYDESDASFQIVSGENENEMFKIATPNEGSLKAGEKYEITWKSKDLLPDDEVELYWTSECKNVGGGRIANTANDDSYTWLVPEKLVSDKCGYKVGIRWSSQPFPYTISDERYDESDEWLWVTDR